jgi:hypothetical protein
MSLACLGLGLGPGTKGGIILPKRPVPGYRNRGCAESTNRSAESAGRGAESAVEGNAILI